MKKLWTPEEEARLAALVEAGSSYAEIADALNRTVESVRGHLRWTKPARDGRRTWLPEHDATLAALWAEGTPVAAIAEAVAHSAAAVACRRMHLGLPPRRRSYTTAERRRVAQAYGTVSTRALARELGRSEKGIVELARLAGVR